MNYTWSFDNKKLFIKHIGKSCRTKLIAEANTFADDKKAFDKNKPIVDFIINNNFDFSEDFLSKAHYLLHFDINEMLNLCNEFYLSLNNDEIYNAFLKSFNKKNEELRIIKCKNRPSGFLVNIDGKNLIKIRNDNTFETLITIIHEYAHAIERNLNLGKNNIFSEVFSKNMEYLAAIYFMKHKNALIRYDASTFLKFYYAEYSNNYRLMLSKYLLVYNTPEEFSKNYQKAMILSRMRIDDLEIIYLNGILKYLIGSFITLSLIKEFNDTIELVTNILDIINSNDCQEVQKKLDYLLNQASSHQRKINYLN